MPTRDRPPIGAPCWVDLMTSDAARSRAFYTELFGWEAEEPNPDFGGYFNFTKGGARLAGGMNAQAGTPDVWSVYLATDDAAKTVEVATREGAEAHVEPMPVADLGTMAFISDPTGAAVGLWQPGTHQGFGVYGEPGWPSWFELLTRDYARAVAFYRDVFGWETHVVEDGPDMRYTTLVHGDEWLAGVMDATGFLPEGVPSHWGVYFGVDDADATVTKAGQLGGSTLMAPEDTPYGRIATVADATGAAFKVVAPNEAMPARASS